MQESVILAVSSAEELVKKIFNVSTVYVFRTFGTNCKVFGMFLLAPGRLIREPASVCVYANIRGELTYVTSLSLEKLSNVKRMSKKDIVMMLDMYNPPCVSTVRFLCYLSDIIDIDLKNMDFAYSFEIYEEVSEDNYAYMIYKSHDLDPRAVSKTVIAMILMKLYLEGKISKDKIIELSRDIEEKLRIV
ncbi:MAG: hypothetical protein GXO26_01605 [Crenarchaeota archaeon]|nr:hypothetical protein [Thermoproteota archaeon]